MFLVVLAVMAAASAAIPTAGATVAGPSSPVSIVDYGYKPKAAKVAMGGEIAWTNTGRARHSATSEGIDPCCTDGPALWASGGLDNGEAFTFTFAAAGTYAYHCTEHTFMKASIKVAPAAKPPSGGVGTTFTVSWASGGVPVGYDVDVQMKAPGGAWTDWKLDRAGSQTSARFRPKAGLGTYQFRARLQKTDTGGASGWSPPATIVVS
jgi:plastocyanin